MSILDLFIIFTAFIPGIIVAFLFFRARVSVFEERARNDLERWKLECSSDIRKDSVNRSRSTLKGRTSEQMAPLLPEFPFSPADTRFIGNPIDFVVFDGYTQAKDEKGDAKSVVLVEVKKGKERFSREETLIKKAVEEGDGLLCAGCASTSARTAGIRSTGNCRCSGLTPVPCQHLPV